LLGWRRDFELSNQHRKEATLARAYVIGNGSLAATGDVRGNLSELYFPYVAPEHQLLRAPARVTIEIDGVLHRLPEAFDVRVDSGDAAPIAVCRYTSVDHSLDLRMESFVDSGLDALIRRVQIVNRSSRIREIRLLFPIELSTGAAKTQTLPEPDAESGGWIHQWGRRAVLVNLEGPEGAGVPLAIADAEGTLAPGLSMRLSPGATGMASAWIACGRSHAEVRGIDAAVRRAGIAELLARTRAHWTLWVSQGTRDLADLPEEVAALYDRSLWLLRLHQTPSGAIVSGLEGDPEASARREYRLAWLWDGAIAADALGRAGYHGVTRRFLTFASRAMLESGPLAAIFDAGGAPAGPASANADVPPIGAFESDPSFETLEGGPKRSQSLAGASILLWAIARHFERDRDVEFLEPLYRGCVIGTAEALRTAIDPATRMPIASLDFWEERRAETLSTAISMEAGLRSAAQLAMAMGEGDRARVFGRAASDLTRGMLREFHRPELGRFSRAIVHRGGRIEADATLDASLLLLPLFGAFEPEDPRVRSSHDAVRRRLWVKTGTGGLARYENDPVDSVGTELADVPGNPWIMPTLWMGVHALRVARRVQDLDPTRTIFLWCAARAGRNGLLAEQLHPYGGEIKGSAPSMQAHAWFVWAVVEYVERMRDLSRCERCGSRAAERRRAVPDLAVEAPLPGFIAHK